MDEQTQQPQENQEQVQPATADNDTGDKPKPTSIIEEANTAAERLEKANAEAARILKENQEIEARRRLGGVSEVPNKPTTKPETDSDYIDRVLREGYPDNR